MMISDLISKIRFRRNSKNSKKVFIKNMEDLFVDGQPYFNIDYLIGKLLKHSITTVVPTTSTNWPTNWIKEQENNDN